MGVAVVETGVDHDLYEEYGIEPDTERIRYCRALWTSES